MSFYTKLAALAVTLSLLVGCSTVYGPTGRVVYNLTENGAVPYTLSSTDFDAACGMAESLLPLVMTFSRYTYTSNRNASAMNMLIGNCAELKGMEETLAYARSIKGQDISGANDARIREKRAYAIAAEREYATYKYMVAQFGEPGEVCPKIKKKHEIYWMLGNLAGLQAVLSDLKSQSVVRVPKDIAMKAVRGMQCLDNEKWWGMPQALEAGIWAMMPDTTPEGVDPWEEMAKAEAIASKKGVRLAHAVAAILADGTGQQEALRAIIRRHGESLDTVEPHPDYQLLDIIGKQHVQAISDRLWTEATGARTPVGYVGKFWDDKAEDSLNIDIDDLLGD